MNLESLFAIIGKNPTYSLIAIIAAVSIVAWFNQSLFNLLALQQNKMKQVWRWFSYGFVHQDLTHLTVNLCTIFFWAPLLIKTVGINQSFWIFVAGTMAPALFVRSQSDADGSIKQYVGASCGASAIFGALAYRLPDYPLVFPYGIRTTILIFTILFVSLGVLFHTNKFRSGIWHLGHVVGCVAGYVVAMPWLHDGLAQLYGVVITAIPLAN